MLGLSFEKLVVVAMVAVFVIGPDRLPLYAARLASAVRALRGRTDEAKERLRQQLGPDFDDTDWTRLDPRRYDPRRIIREALVDDEPTTAPAAVAPRVRVSSNGRSVREGRPADSGADR